MRAKEVIVVSLQDVLESGFHRRLPNF